MAAKRDHQDIVIVTGFGPFGVYDVNASWEAVKKLSDIGLGNGFKLVIEEVPVSYSKVKTIVPSLWKSHKPKLVVHVGVSGIAKELTLEQQAHNDGYDKDDIEGAKADNLCCVDGADNCMVADINMKCVCDHVNSESEVKAVVSHDPGRYLCDFSYFTSLHIDKSRCAFIHVPPLDNPYSVDQLAQGLREAIIAMLKQVS